MSIPKEKADFDLVAELEIDKIDMSPDYLKKAVAEIIRLNREMLAKM